jgi:hypothetical protein
MKFKWNRPRKRENNVFKTYPNAKKQANLANFQANIPAITDHRPARASGKICPRHQFAVALSLEEKTDQLYQYAKTMRLKSTFESRLRQPRSPNTEAGSRQPQRHSTARRAQNANPNRTTNVRTSATRNLTTAYRQIRWIESRRICGAGRLRRAGRPDAHPCAGDRLRILRAQPGGRERGAVE